MATTSKGLFGSSLARKYWMAVSGLFLCTFLVGHLLGNFHEEVMGGKNPSHVSINGYEFKKADLDRVCSMTNGFSHEYVNLGPCPQGSDFSL